MQNFNIAPYFDDFDTDKNFYKALFVPTRPVQTRELNQIQSILQNQIKSAADHVFKNGTMVIPGHVYYDNKIISLKLVRLYNDVSADLIIDDLVGKTLVGTDTGISALVVHYDVSTATDAPTIYVKLISSSDDEEIKTFKNNEVLYWDQNAATKVKLESVSAVNSAAIVTVNEGIYYINGFFVRVAKQTITLAKYTNTPTYRAGLEVRESIVTATEDSTLYDNALGYSNYAAPGADRYKIDLILSKRSFNYNDLETTDEEGNVLEEKFVDLVHVKNGVLIQEVNRTEYSEIEKIFARRTFDESGDYEVSPFNVIPKEYRSNIRGNWVSGYAYLEGDYVKSNNVWWEALNDGVAGATAPNSATAYKMSDGAVNWVAVNTTQPNGGIFIPASTESLTTQQANKDKVVYQVKPGKAYVRGFEVETKSDQQIIGAKALDYKFVNDEIVATAAGSYTDLTNMAGLPNLSSYEQVDIYNYTRDEITNFDTIKTQATATYTVTGGVITAVTLTNIGLGYDRNNPPTVTAPAGTGAVLKAFVSLTGEIQEIRIINGGTGYTNGSLTIGAPTADPTRIGTCRIRSLDYNAGTIGDATAKYRCQIFDIKLNQGYDWTIHAKSVMNTGADFKADIVEQLVRIPGLVNVEGDPTPTKQITGVGTEFINNVKGGQYIIIGGSVRRKTRWITQSDNVLYLTQSIASDLTSQTIDVVYSSLFSITSNLVVPFSKQFVRNVRGSDDTEVNVTYTVKRHHSSVTVTGGNATITLSAVGETFAPIVAGNYIVANNSGGTIIGAATFSLDSNATTLTISNLGGAGSVEVITSVEKTNVAAREKTKTRAVKTMTVSNVATLKKAELALTEADVYRLISVKKMVGAGVDTTPADGSYDTVWNSANTVDITKFFILDNGQTPFYYGRGSLKKAKGCPVLDNTIQITFEYFNHSAGDYFTVNSYVDVPRDKIDPALRDTIDFRPRISDSGVDFTSAGSSITEPSSLSSHFKADYSYYLPRKDIITINSNGEFEIVAGESSYSLREPKAKSDTMIVAVATLSPGTYGVNGTTIEIEKKEHKRYTMADIGKLERRINNLEYYTQLSLLEQEVIDKNVVDQNGLDRFKAGIIVDDFNSQAVSDASHPDFLCALDMDQGELRAFADTTSIEMNELYLSDTQRQSNWYKMTGDILTLPYTNVTCIEQPVASRTEFVNPFAVVTFTGEVLLYPSQDTWFEERRAPNIIVNRDGNFNSIMTLAERQGVLGTRWNAWQTNWTGFTTTTTTTNNWWGRIFSSATSVFQSLNGSLTQLQTTLNNQAWTTANSSNTWGGVVANVTATVNGTQTRTGTQTAIVSRIDRQVIDDRIIETGVAPFIRTRPVVFKATGLKPNTRMYAFFDGVDVTDYIQPMDELVIPEEQTDIVTSSFKLQDQGIVDDEENIVRRIGRRWFRVGEFTNVERKAGVFFDRGDVVSVFNGSTDTGARAIIVDIGFHHRNGVRRKFIKLLNRINSTTFTWGTTVVTGGTYTIKSSSGNAVAPFNEDRSPGLVTDSMGNLYGTFVIPNNDTHKFETGIREFKLTDSKDNNDMLSTTSGSAQYTATGIVQIRQSTIANVRNAEIVTRQITESQNVSTTLTAQSATRPSDPLAQTFTISEAGGAFITQAEVYFAVKDTNLPVRCEIRDVVNGYPGPRVLARKSLPASDVVVNSTGLTPTVFTFPRPTYLLPGVEYCVVLLSDSNVYKVWIARMGETNVGTGQIITSQPNLGSLFKSQNNSTWTAEQYEDLTFKLYKAKFDISRAANVLFVNKRLPTVGLDNNPMYAVSGSGTVRVHQPNHGFIDGDTVAISGAIAGPFATGLGTTYLAGNDEDDTATYVVSNVEYDYYTISIGTNATYTGYFGGDAIEATYQIQYSTITPNLQVQVFPETESTVAVRPLNGEGSSQYVFENEFEVLNRENVHFTSPMLIASHENEEKRLAKNKSFRIRVTMTSTDENLSPVLDVERASLVLVRNKIDNPTLANINDDTFDNVTICTSGTITWNYDENYPEESYFETTDTALFDDFDKISAGKYINVSAGTNSGKTLLVTKTAKIDTDNDGDDEVYRVWVDGSTAFTDAVAGTSTIVLHNRFVHELAPFNTSALSTYVSQPMRLAVPANGVRVTLDANIPTGTTMEVWQRSMMLNADEPFHMQRWYKVNSTVAVNTTADFQTFTEIVYEQTNMQAFDIVQTKIVMKSDNKALTPRVKSLRVMALV